MTILGRAYTIARMSRETGIPSDQLLGMVKEAKARKFPNACTRLLKGGLDLAKKFKVSLLSKGGEREFIYTEHIYLRSLIEELGLNLVDLQAVDKNLETQETYFLEGRLVSLAEIITDFAPIVEQVKAHLKAIAKFKDYTTKIPATVELDNISIAEYLDQIPQTTPVIRQLVKAAYETYYGLNMEEQSSLNLILFNRYSSR